jgi:hypothetical protein
MRGLERARRGVGGFLVLAPADDPWKADGDARLVPRRERHPLEGELMARIVGDFP